MALEGRATGWGVGGTGVLEVKGLEGLKAWAPGRGRVAALGAAANPTLHC